jgi:hypothetical protein
LRKVWAWLGMGGQPVVARWKNHGSDTQQDIGLELDTGMVLAAAEAEKRGETLPLVAQA